MGTVILVVGIGAVVHVVGGLLLVWRHRLQNNAS